jgi:hypothetical protein
MRSASGRSTCARRSVEPAISITSIAPGSVSLREPAIAAFARSSSSTER